MLSYSHVEPRYADAAADLFDGSIDVINRSELTERTRNDTVADAIYAF